MIFIKKLLVLTIGLLIAFCICEIFLYIYGYKPLVIVESKDEKFSKEDFIKWAYVDIHKPFFLRYKDTFSIDRQDIWIPRNDIKSYSINKKENQKRIFILGESVARFYPEEILKKELLKYLHNVEIINVGMGAYDSYRIEKISKEISFFNPDYVVICIGNNDGIREYWSPCEIDPVDINYLPYKYNVIKKSKVLSLLSNLICSEIKLTKDTVEENFKNNILKIVENLKKTNIIFCELPNNEYCRYCDIFDNLIQLESKKEYEKNIWKNSFEYSHFTERIKLLKQISDKYDNVYLANLKELLAKYTNDNLNFNIFIDDCHFNEPTYLLLSQIITKIIVEKEKNLNIDLCLTRKEYLTLLNKDKFEIIKNRNIFSSYSIAFENISFLFEKDVDDFYELCNKYWIDFKENIDLNIYNKLIIFADVLQNRNKIKESKEILNNLIKLAPDKFEAYLIMGYIEYKNNNFEQADKYFSKVKELHEDSYIDVSFLKSLKQKN